MLLGGPGKQKVALVGSQPAREALSQSRWLVRTTHRRKRFNRPPPGRARGATSLAGSTRHTNMSERALPPTFLRPTLPRSQIRRAPPAAGVAAGGEAGRIKGADTRAAASDTGRPVEASPRRRRRRPPKTWANGKANAEPSFRYAMGETNTCARKHFHVIYLAIFGCIWPAPGQAAFRLYLRVYLDISVLWLAVLCRAERPRKRPLGFFIST